MQKSDSDPIIIVVPSDHLIKDNKKFLSTVEKGEQLAQEGYIVTFGIKPDYPETGYGYINTAEKQAKDLRLKNSLKNRIWKLQKNIFTKAHILEQRHIYVQSVYTAK